MVRSETEVDEHRGIKRGDRVRITAEKALRYSMAGISKDYVERLVSPGEVARIFVSEKYGWSSFKVVRDDGFGTWHGVDDIEKENRHADG